MTDIPSIKPGRDAELTREALALQEFQADLRAKKTKFNLFVIDACRNNPFERTELLKSVGSATGLANPEPLEGTFTMYSAGRFETALDRLSLLDNNPNSVYMRNLLRLLRTPDITLTDMATRVRVEVRRLAESINHLQTPAFYSQIIGDACLSGQNCGAKEFVPSVEQGRYHLARDNLHEARRHFEALANQNNALAMVEMAKLSDRSQNHSAVIEWLARAAATGDMNARLELMWAASAPEYFRNLSKQSAELLRGPPASDVRAKELFGLGKLEAALALQLMLDEKQPAGTGKPVNLAPQLTEAANRNYPPAIAKLGTLILQNLPRDDELKPQHKEDAKRAIELIEKSARLNDVGGLYYAVLDEQVAELRQKFSLPLMLTDLEIGPRILKAAEVSLLRTGVLNLIREAAGLEFPTWNVQAIRSEAIKRLNEGKGMPKNSQEALRIAVANVAEHEIYVRQFTKESRTLGDARRLMAQALEAAGQRLEAVQTLIAANDEADLPKLVELGNSLAWSGPVEQLIQGAFQAKCMSEDAQLGNDEEQATGCMAAAISLTALKRTAFYAMIDAMVRGWLEPKNAEQPKDGIEKARALLLLARLAEASKSYLSSGQTVESMFGQAAVMGSPEALQWLKDRGITPPKPTERSEKVVFSGTGLWNGGGERLGGKFSICWTGGLRAITTRNNLPDRKPFFYVVARQPIQGDGRVEYNAGVANIDPASFKMFIGRDEVKVSGSIANTLISVEADQTALIQRLARGALVRIEFKAGDAWFVDVISLDGFSASYAATVAGCSGMTSALTKPARVLEVIK